MSRARGVRVIRGRLANRAFLPLFCETVSAPEIEVGDLGGIGIVVVAKLPQ